MEIEGKLVNVLPVQNISSQKGQMKKMEFVVEFAAKFPRKICFALWNDKIDVFSAKTGDNIKVYFDLESREYNGRWYTEAKAWKVENLASSENTGNGENTENIKDDLPSTFTSQKEDLDDLPF
jgi:Domain of unknown function (DUF3127)